MLSEALLMVLWRLFKSDPNNFVSSANSIIELDGSGVILQEATLFTKMTNRSGPMTLPCGTPLNTSKGDETHEPIQTCWTRLLKKFSSQLTNSVFKPYDKSIFKRKRWLTESNALLMSV